MSATPFHTEDPASNQAFSASDDAFHELVVSRVVDETADTRSFVFEIPDRLREAFAYVAGQFLTVEVPFEGMLLKRCYSLSSSPDTESEHKVTVKRVVDGRVSNWLNERVTAGDRVRVLPPAGLFVLKPRTRPIALFGGGSGITPLLSILKSALATTERRIQLVYANRDRASIIFRDEIDGLAERHAERFRLVHHLDAESGFLDRGRVTAHLENWEESDFYICGPGPFMDVVEGSVLAIGAERERIFVERFVSPRDPDRIDPASLAGPPPGAAQVEARVRVQLRGAAHIVDCHVGQTILEAARCAGLKPPSNCEDGYCSVCRARLLDGEVWMRTHDALTGEEVQARWVLTCQARPTTAVCTVDYDQG